MVGTLGLEPKTYPLKGDCSTHLSYVPIYGTPGRS